MSGKKKKPRSPIHHPSIKTALGYKADEPDADVQLEGANEPRLQTLLGAKVLFVWSVG
jgi:hypothetical protein